MNNGLENYTFDELQAELDRRKNLYLLDTVAELNRLLLTLHNAGIKLEAYADKGLYLRHFEVNKENKIEYYEVWGEDYNHEIKKTIELLESETK